MGPGEIDIRSEDAPRLLRGPLNGHLLAFSMALLGGLLGIFGAFLQEVREAGDLLLPFVGGPIIEEVLKPAGVYVLLLRWPHLLRSQPYTASLAALSGLCFAIVESTVYVTLYVPEHTKAFLLYRFTAPVLMHTLASFVVGFGINQRLLASMRGEIPLLAGNRRFFAAGIVLHALFNILAVALGISGILSIE